MKEEEPETTAEDTEEPEKIDGESEAKIEEPVAEAAEVKEGLRQTGL